MPNELLEKILEYLQSDKDKISSVTVNKEIINDPYIKEYIKKRKEDHLINEAMEERIILEYNDMYPYDYRSIYETSPPSFETFKKHWIKTKKQEFTKPQTPKSKTKSKTKTKTKSKTKTKPKPKTKPLKRLWKRLTRKRSKTSSKKKTT